MVLLFAVAAAIVLWPGSPQTGTPAAGTPGGAGEITGPQTVDDPAPAGPEASLKKQAGQVDALLTEMSSTRAELGRVVVDDCPTSPMERVRDQRQEQLGKARALQVGGLENGAALRDALVRALEASVESNRRYVEAGPGCPADDMVAHLNDRASQAKRDFIDHWRPNAEKAGLAVRSADTI